MGPSEDLSAQRISALGDCGPPGALVTTPGHATRMVLPMLPPPSALSVCLSPAQPARPCDPGGPDGVTVHAPALQ